MKGNINDLHPIKICNIIHYYCPRMGMLYTDNAGFHHISMAAFSAEEYRQIIKLVKPIENEYKKSRGY